MVSVGYIRRAHGVRGAVIVQPLSDHPERFVTGARFATDSDTNAVLVVESVRSHKEGLLVGFNGVVDRDTADDLRGVALLIPAGARRPLGEDEFWPDQLEGLIVADLAGRELGRVVGVIPGDAQDLLQVEGRGGVFEVPFVAALVPTVDLEAKLVVVDLPEGLVR
jgi:16S rRNA processing protein RimM